MKSVSVVVPVYNTEEYLAQCLDSLVDQTLEDIEILVVNDGSPDNSQEIIDRYARQYPDKIVALKKPNGGLGDARNYGVARATGRYVGFVDSDDFVDPDMYRHLYELARQSSSDVAICRYKHYSLDGSYSSFGGKFPFEEGAVFSSDGFFLNSRVMVVVNKIYRTDLAKRFPFQNTWFEDVAWSPVIMSYADRITYTPQMYYHYIKRDGTITTTHGDARTLDEIKSIRSALANANPQRVDEVAYMAARRLLFDAKVRPAYADRFIQAIHELRREIGGSRFVQADPTLYLLLDRYLDPQFQTIPKTVLYREGGQTDVTDVDWKNQLAFHVDTEYIDIEDLEPDRKDPVTEMLLGRTDVLSHYLCLKYIQKNGGIYFDERLRILKPIAWALHASRSFFVFSDAHSISSLLFGSVAGTEEIESLISLFVENLEAQDPLQEALDSYFVRSGRVKWSYGDVEANFGRQHIEVQNSCRVYASSIFINDFGLGMTTTALYPQVLRENMRGSSGYAVTEFYYDISQKISLDFARWQATKSRRNKISSAPSKGLRTRVNEALEGRASAKRLVRGSYRTAVGMANSVFSLYERRKRRSAIDRVLRSTENKNNEYYLHCLRNLPVDDDLVLMESFYGRGILSSPAAIFEAWIERPDFGNYRFVWVLDRLENHVDLRGDYERRFSNVTFVERDSRDYLRVLASAKYLINDVTFYFNFIKRPEQIYVNTWHSITLKTLGYDVPGSSMGAKNVVRNLLSCDYIVAPNEFMLSKIFGDSHMMRGIMPGQYFVGGHPRSDLTIRTSRDDAIDVLRGFGAELDEVKPTIVYAPTWRGSSGASVSDDLDQYRKDIDFISRALDGKANVLLRVHQYVFQKALDSGLFDGILAPSTYDANRMFAATDILITDYSSICFDFLVTGRPMLFYVPDAAEYEDERGTYFRAQDLPGPVREKIEEIVSDLGDLLDGKDSYRDRRIDDRALLCPHDDGNVSARLLDTILSKRDSDVESASSLRSHETPRLRALLYVGSFAKPQSADRARLISRWLRATLGEDVDVSVIVTDRNFREQTMNAYSVIKDRIRPIARSAGHMVLSSESRKAIMTMPRSLARRRSFNAVVGGMLVEWSRCLGDATFDYVIVATPRGGMFETALLGTASSGKRVLCEMGNSRPQALSDSFDVVLKDLPALHDWIELQD